MKISVKEANLKTVSIEIKSLQINSKQMTLAVFRQLDEKPVIDYKNRKLLGNVWGRVNYCPSKKCESSHEHFHIIWEFDGNLYKDQIKDVPLKVTDTRSETERQSLSHYEHLRDHVNYLSTYTNNLTLGKHWLTENGEATTYEQYEEIIEFQRNIFAQLKLKDLLFIAV